MSNKKELETKEEEKKESKSSLEKINNIAKESSKSSKKQDHTEYQEILLALPLMIIFAVVMVIINWPSKSYGEFEDQHGKESFKIGEVFESKYIKVKLNTTNLNYTNNSPFSTIQDGYKIVQYKFTGENISDETMDFSFAYFKCYADNKEMDHYSGYQDEDPNPSRKVKAGQTAEVHVYCEVPENASSIYVEFHPLYANKTYQFLAK